jgi:uncharacterized membrane protein
MGKSRLEAFSDGVIAIIITIMVLELKVPEGADWNALKSDSHMLLNYAISFALIGIYWNNHHHLLHTVKHISAGIMWANLNLLFWLSLIPFDTAWMGENHKQPLPVALYALLLAVCGISYNILQKVIAVCHKDQLELKEVMRRQKQKGIFSAALYIIAIPLAYVNTTISIVLFITVAITWFIPDKKIEHIKNE